MHIREILDAIPHRFPFLLVDRVVEVVPGQRILAYKNVTINEEFFVGHFPQRPIMPGVLVLEAMAQAAAVLVHKTIAPNLRDADIFFMAIDGARFRRPIVPGDRLMLELTVLKQKSSVWKFRGLATVDGERAAEAELMAKWVLPARGEAAARAADSSGGEGAE